MKDQLQILLLSPVFSLVRIGSDVLNKSVCFRYPFILKLLNIALVQIQQTHRFFNYSNSSSGIGLGSLLAYVKINTYKWYLLLVMLTRNARCQGANSF